MSKGEDAYITILFFFCYYHYITMSYYYSYFLSLRIYVFCDVCTMTSTNIHHNVCQDVHMHIPYFFGRLW